MREGFVIHWNGSPTRIVDHGRCDAFWRSINAFHASKYPGGVIPGALYSFGMCPHGIRYEAQGWNKPQGANGDGTHSRNYSVIAFIGEGEVPSIAMLAGLRDLVVEGRMSGRAGGRVLAHRQVNQTACPGDDLARIAQQWDRQALPQPQPPTAPDEEDDMKRWIVRAPSGAVYVWDGATLRPANDPMYRLLLRYHGALCPDPSQDTWYEWSQAGIDTALAHSGDA